MFESPYWLLLTVIGPLVIAGVIAYALLTRRRLTPREKIRQHDAVEDVYHGGEGGDHAPSAEPRRSAG